MVRTRFSPSPTGFLHLGNARSALFSALFAAHTSGIFLLRIEDTDQARSEHQFTESLLMDLHWLTIKWQEGPHAGGDKGPYWQSQRQDIYLDFYKKLKDLKHAYPCFCTDEELTIHRKTQLARGIAPRYPGTCLKISPDEVKARIDKGEKPALRFQVPHNQIIEFVDLVKGPQHFNSSDIGDFIIRRADGSSSFLFCNAIDDSLMGVTHIIRGEDHLTNTPRQLMILQTLNLFQPRYGHLSLIVGEDGAKLSKRHGSFSVKDLREGGYLSIATLNYLARLSHNYEQNHLLSFAELAHYFHLEKISKSAARFDHNQLLHWQKSAVLKLTDDEVWEWLGESIQTLVPKNSQNLFAEVMRQNILFPKEAEKWAHILFDRKKDFSKELINSLEDVPSTFFEVASAAVKKNGTDMQKILEAIKFELSLTGKKLFMPLRLALTGESHGPELAQIALLMGADGLLQRLEFAAKVYEKNHAKNL